MQRLEDQVKPRTPLERLKEQQRRSGSGDTHEQSEIDDEAKEVKYFIRNCNDNLDFEGVLERAGMDHEAIGWAAIEVIRGADMKIKKLAHMPAERLRVKRGWTGFVETLGGSAPDRVHYQAFGDKVVSMTRTFNGKKQPYNPYEDGELNEKNAQWQLVDSKTGQPTEEFKQSANEILYIPRHHSATIYYGYTDIVPAAGSLLGNVHIRDYMLQYFEHNTIPRYAIVVEGAKLGAKVLQAITEYFSSHIKGKAHKTLIIPVPALRGEVKLRFEKLASDSTEGSFQETKKNNSQNILTAHGVSPAIVGIADAANLGSGKGLSQAEIYKDRIVTPLQKQWQRSLNKLFSRGLGVRLIAITFNPLDIRDRGSEKDVLLGYQDKGVLSINEVRKLAGLGPPLEGGDRPFIVVGNQIYFVDELDDMLSSAIEEAEQEAETLRVESQARRLDAAAARANGDSRPDKPATPPANASSGTSSTDTKD
jgi:capsid portal protein